MAKTPEDVLKLAEESDAQIVDFRFIDLPGVWQHFSIPATEFDADMFTDGLGFDGSSIRGFQQIQESDMLLMPDPTTAYMDPMRTARTLSIICNVEDPLTRQPYSRDPRYIAQKAEAYLKGSGIADTSYWASDSSASFSTTSRRRSFNKSPRCPPRWKARSRPWNVIMSF